MLERIAWGYGKIAFDAAQDESFPEPMRRIFRRLGTMWFWLASLLEGRALAAVCERRRHRLGRVALVNALATLRARWQRRLRPAQQATPPLTREVPVVEAWSLPNLAALQRLGLGDVWAVRCPFCRDFHTHVPGEGTRQAGCALGLAPDSYTLCYVGALPRALHDAFSVSIRQTWPKLLLEWPQHDSPPSLLEAA